jgi:SAM-dependent methyltransferase
VNQSTPKPVENRLREWHGSPLGALLAEFERRMTAEALDDVFGLQLLQIGEWGEPGRLLENARTQRAAVITSHTGTVTDKPAQPRVRSKASELPVASDSVDAVLLPHTLEFESDPYAVLREVERILIGEGHLLVLGFKPLGTWGLRHRLVVGGFPPGLERLISAGRLRDWLALLGFEVVAARRFLHRLPVSPRHPVRIAGVEWRVPVPSSAYLLKARKRVYTLTPIRLRKRERRSMVGGLVEPTTRLPT